MKNIQTRWFLIASVLYLTNGAIQAVQRYEVIDLGHLYVPMSFNDKRQIVLLKAGPKYYQNSMHFWQNGQITQLYQADGAIAMPDINNSGTISAAFFGFNSPDYSMLIHGNQIDVLPSVIYLGINDAGQIVSRVRTSVNTQTHVINPDGSSLNCGNNEAPDTEGFAINNRGQVTGTYGDVPFNFDAFIWDAVSGMRFLPRLDGDIGAVGWDINMSGMVVGFSVTSYDPDFTWERVYNLVLWEPDGNILDLGCNVPSVNTKLALNEMGHIVGNFKFPDDKDFLPYFWQNETGFIAAQDLLDGDSPWTITELIKINNLDQIIGTATIDGQSHGILLMPIPEPGTVSLMVLGFGLLRRKAGGRRQEGESLCKVKS